MIIPKSVLITTKQKGDSLRKLNWSLIFALLLINYMTLGKLFNIIALHFSQVPNDKNILHYMTPKKMQR